MNTVKLFNEKKKIFRSEIIIRPKELFNTIKLQVLSPYYKIEKTICL